MAHPSAFPIRLSILGSVASLLLGAPWSVYGQQGRGLETISEAWKKREAQVRSLKINWVEKHTVAKGSLSDFLMDLDPRRLEQMGIKPGTTIPPEDVTFEIPCAVYIDGTRMRHERDDRQWSAKEQAYVVEPYVTTYNGQTGKHFRPSGSSYTPWPTAIVRSNCPEANSLYLSPLFMTFRASVPLFRLFDLETMKATNRSLKIKGRACVEWERRSGDHYQKIWLDPSRDWVLVMYQNLSLTFALFPSVMPRGRGRRATVAGRGG